MALKEDVQCTLTLLQAALVHLSELEVLEGNAQAGGIDALGGTLCEL
jgi:hypothetical protein